MQGSRQAKRSQDPYRSPISKPETRSNSKQHHSRKYKKQGTGISQTSQQPQPEEVDYVNPSNNNNNNASFVEQELPNGESIKVALRVRPMNNMELNRGDSSLIKDVEQGKAQVMTKNGLKSFQFNNAIDPTANQQEVFYKCEVDKLIDSVLDGYSATVLAYGQTGSGKTYTMAGMEEKLGQDVYISDETEGLIQRSFRYLWQSMVERNEKFYMKASFLEIYNEQIQDLLNPTSGILQMRWNTENGFFVEDLVVVECTNVDDLIAVLNEGIKNRKVGSHELNKDSSRSHTILTVYVISETETQDQTVRKYGKISFVDLAGSERLKDSKSGGGMAKETGNINKSLFALGRVISGLADKKGRPSHIHYRDSKLTMLLMDSLGGTSKALFIACISPSNSYIEETLSTISYATRAMNIKNMPTIQMDPKEQVIYNLNRENEMLRKENEYLREQVRSLSNGGDIPQSSHNSYSQNQENEAPSTHTKKPPLQVPYSPPQKTMLPPLTAQKRPSDQSRKASQSQDMSGFQDPTDEDDEYQIEVPLTKILSECQKEISLLKGENLELRKTREIYEKKFNILQNDNSTLRAKLENVENVFIMGNQKGKKKKSSLPEEYMIHNLVSENDQLKIRLKETENKLSQLAFDRYRREKVQETTQEQVTDIVNEENVEELTFLRQNFGKMQERLQYLEQREHDLVTLVHTLKKQRQ